MIESLAQLPLTQRWQQQRYPMLSVLAVLTRSVAGETHYLLIRRIKAPYAGKWALVGGKWDFGESLRQAVVREVKEETGLDARFVAVRGLVDERLLPAGDADQGAHFVLFVCELHAPAGQATEQQEGIVGWFTAAQLAALKAEEAVVPTDYAILEYCRRHALELPYVEADVQASEYGNGVSRLLRFESVSL